MTWTKEKIRAHYVESEARVDRILLRMVQNPATLALFAGWTLAAVAFGWWAGK